MAIFRKGKEISNQMHKDKVIKQIYHLGKEYLPEWFKIATQQAIIAAFGFNEGTQVIRLTNDYLNAIAATDTGRAQQMAAFISEDPLLVCSLVETSKVRYLVGDGVAWIDTKVNPTTAIGAEMEFILGATQVVNNPSFYGSRSSNGFLLGNDSNGNLYVNITTQSLSGVRIEAGTLHKVWTQGTKFIDNGKEFACAAPTAVSYAIALFARRYQANEVERIAVMSVASFKLFEAEDKLHFIPMQRTDGTCGMLDLVSFTFYSNANTSGQFTIQLTDKEK